MFEVDRDYYQHRAEVELECAQQARLPEVVSAHYRMAEACLDRPASGPASSDRVRINRS